MQIFFGLIAVNVNYFAQMEHRVPEANIAVFIAFDVPVKVIGEPTRLTIVVGYWLKRDVVHLNDSRIALFTVAHR